MKLVSFKTKNQDQLGLYIQDQVFGVKDCGLQLPMEMPLTMKDFLKNTEDYLPLLAKLQSAIENKPYDFQSVQNPVLLAPVPHPPSLKDGYAFRQHVETMRKNRGAEIAPEFDQFPIFYFSNHNAVFGPGEILAEKDHFEKLDFELEIAVVIGKRGMNIPSDKADDYILGYMIWNDWSARLLQTEEMTLSLGPAKGKDFANSFGPFLVTKDELSSKKISTKEGDQYDLRMQAKHNGKLISDGSSKTMHWTFAQIIERVSYGAEIFPGDIIGSGTVGTGCFAELNSTGMVLAKAKGDDFTPTWIKPGDEIELLVEGLGSLKNKVQLRTPEYSILAKKKNV